MMNLDDAQFAAATEPAEWLMVDAGAGTGKTRTLLARVQHYLNTGVPPAQILILAFSRHAVRELRVRLEGLDIHGVRVHTIHGWCLWMLRRRGFRRYTKLPPNFVVWSAEDSRELLRQIAAMHRMQVSLERKTVTEILKSNPDLATVFRVQQRRSNAIIYEDLLDRGLALLKHPLAWHTFHRLHQACLIDEGQDLSRVQWDLSLRLSPEYLTVVGSAPQSIYQWRDARPELYAKEWCSQRWAKIALTTNYRSSVAVVAAANACARAMRNTDTPALVAASDEPGVVTGRNAFTAAYQMALDEGFAPGEIAILGRTWHSLRLATEELKSAGVSVEVMAPAEPTEDERRLWWLLRLLALPADRMAAWALAAHWLDWQPAKIFDQMERSVKRRVPMWHGSPIQGVLRDTYSAQTNPRLALELVADRSGLLHSDAHLMAAESLEAFLEATPPENRTVRTWLDWRVDQSVESSPSSDPMRKVSVAMSVHQAKGLEWPCVILAHTIEGVWPTSGDVSDTERLEESRRLFYVALTRARKSVYMVAPWTYDTPWGSTVECAVSRFAEEVGL